MKKYYITKTLVHSNAEKEFTEKIYFSHFDNDTDKIKWTNNKDKAKYFTSFTAAEILARELDAHLIFELIPLC